MNERQVMIAYLEAEKASFDALEAERPELASILERTQHWLQRTRGQWRQFVRQEIPIPANFMQPYSIPKADFFTGLSADDAARRHHDGKFIQIKYQLRAYNIMREYMRLRSFLPELFDGKAQFSLIEFSSGGCGSLEVAREFGHSLQPLDFIAGRGAEYRPIHKALGADVINFNGRERPYGFADKSYDIVVCNQAVDAYGSPEDHIAVINEFKRIARRKVQVVFNPYRPEWNRDTAETWRPKMHEDLAKWFPGEELRACPSTGLPAIVFDLER